MACCVHLQPQWRVCRCAKLTCHIQSQATVLLLQLDHLPSQHHTLSPPLNRTRRHRRASLVLQAAVHWPDPQSTHLVHIRQQPWACLAMAAGKSQHRQKAQPTGTCRLQTLHVTWYCTWKIQGCSPNTCWEKALRVAIKGISKHMQHGCTHHRVPSLADKPATTRTAAEQSRQ